MIIQHKKQIGTFQQILARILLLGIFFVFLGMNAFAASISVKVIDTIAGYPTLLQSQKLDPYTDVTFKVEKPDGGVITLPARANANGFAETELNGYHTKKAGLYKASLAKSGRDAGSPSNFQVFAGPFSPVKSKILTDKNSLAAKNDTLTVRVAIKDQYDNPIKGHLVQLFSSRTDDVIKYSGSNTTNEQGVAVFYVQSKTEGVSIFTAIDLNVNQEVFERSKVAFYKPEEKFSFGGNDFLANLTGSQVALNDEALILDHFDISFPSTVSVNDDQNHLKVTAKDAQGNTVRNYTGTIKIAVSGDDNAVIPNEGEYTFSDKDQGEKEFALAMIFTTIGNVTIEVYDYENGQINPRIKGEKNVKVLEKAVETENTNTNTSSELLIKSPSNGSEIASKALTVSGMATANTNLKLMLDDIKVADISVDSEGFFATSIQDLDDGSHEIYVMETEGLRQSSAPVQFTIDATPPRIDEITLFPEEALQPEKSYTLTVYSEAGLDYAKIRVAGMEEPLNESVVQPGKYEGSFIAPKETGSYTIDVLLSDRMGNLGDYRNQAKLEVGEKKTTITAPKNIEITPDDQSLEIQWEAADSEKSIDHYVIYVGNSEYELKAVGKTQKLGARLNNLQNGKAYFIAITTIDSEGTESQKSTILKAIPAKSLSINLSAESADATVVLSWETDSEVAPDYYSVYFGTDTDDLQKIKNTKSQSVTLKKLENGKEYYFAVSATIQGKEGKKSEVISASPESFHGSMPTNAPLRAIAGDSKVTLSWNSNAEALRYKIAFGIQSQRYEASILTSNEATSYVVKDLINGLPYYFTVYALDADGFEISAPYTEVKAIPNGYGFSITQDNQAIPKTPTVQPSKVKELDKTGPEIWAFLAISLTLASGFFFFYRSRLAYNSPIQHTEQSVISTRKIQF